ncbi:MAG: D-2-hydroxyacid dehydrogenase [Phycisphaeraceae bacterium]
MNAIHSPRRAGRIVVLDGHTLTPATTDHTPDGEPSWSALDALGQLEVHPRTPKGKIAETAAGAGAVLTNKAPLDAATFEKLPDLRYVGVLATGVNVVDLEAARRHGVVVTNIPAYSTPSVAQHVFALLLELATRTAEHNRSVHDGDWADSPDFSYTIGPTVELHGKKLGILGMGTIGRAVARIGHAMGMTLLAHSRTRKDLDVPVEWVELDRLFAESDALTLHCPLTEDTRGVVNGERLKTMKRSAFLINTGRGPLIDESALADALREERIAGAGLDVLSTEPPEADNPLLTAPRCVITPHIAWATRAARHRCMRIAVDNFEAFLLGTPQNVVNP